MIERYNRWDDFRVDDIVINDYSGMWCNITF